MAKLSKEEQTKLEVEAGIKATSDARTVLEDLAGTRQVLKNTSDGRLRKMWDLQSAAHSNATNKLGALILLEMSRRRWKDPDYIPPNVVTALMEIVGYETNAKNS